MGIGIGKFAEPIVNSFVPKVLTVVQDAPILHTISQVIGDSFENKTLKFISPKVKSSESFSLWDVIKSGFKNKTKLAMIHNTSKPIVEETSDAINQVKKFILGNKSNIVKKNLNTANYTLEYKDGTIIKITEPHNMLRGKMTPEKLILITDRNNNNITIPAFADENNSEIYNLFVLVDNLYKLQ
jgi:hypothetical protein